MCVSVCVHVCTHAHPYLLASSCLASLPLERVKLTAVADTAQVLGSALPIPGVGQAGNKRIHSSSPPSQPHKAAYLVTFSLANRPPTLETVLAHTPNPSPGSAQLGTLALNLKFL